MINTVSQLFYKFLQILLLFRIKESNIIRDTTETYIAIQ